MDPEGEMGHRSVRVKAAKEERGGLKEADMEVDGEAPERESAELQSPIRKVIRTEDQESEVAKVSIRELEEQVLSSNEARINVVRITRPARNKKIQKLFQKIFHQKRKKKLFQISATITAVKMRSDTRSLRRWSLKKVEKLEQ